EERFYNLMCLAYGADPVTFGDLTQDGYLPPNRSPGCRFEYDTLAYAFHREISPHIDQQMARQVLDTAWFSNVPPPSPTAPRPRGRRRLPGRRDRASAESVATAAAGRPVDRRVEHTRCALLPLPIVFNAMPSSMRRSPHKASPFFSDRRRDRIPLP